MNKDMQDIETYALIDDTIHSHEYKKRCTLHMMQLAQQVLQPENITIYDWFKKYVKSAESAISSSYDIELTPYMREVAESYLLKPSIKHINVLASTGSREIRCIQRYVKLYYS